MVLDETSTGQMRSGSAQELQALLDAAIDAVIVIDSRGHIETFNRAAEQMFGFAAAEVLGQNVSMLMPEPDRGPGVEPGALANLFNPFFTTKAHGTGLGLAISRTIVQAHGGKLAYREQPGGGACFHFTLPALERVEP